MEEQLDAKKEVVEMPTEIAETSAESTDSKDYPMDMNPIKVQINAVPSLENPSYVTHTMRKPSFVEEEARERNMPLLTSDAGKIDGSEASSMTIDDEPANKEMYDKLVISVSGYALKPGDKASEEVSPDTLIDTKNGQAKVRDLIPSSHKSTVINGMFPSSFEVDVDDQEYVFALGGGREWRIKQELGGKAKRDDGTLSPPDYTIFYTFREPTELERKKFRTKAVSAVTLRNPKTNAITERRSTNLGVMRELFDALVINIEGATINNKAIRVGDKEQVELIPATFKKGTMIRLFNFLEADLKN